jgi:hypothetical protein
MTGVKVGDMVRLREAQYGFAQGPSAAHGDGRACEVPAGAMCEVFAIDRTTGWLTMHFDLVESWPREPFRVEIILAADDVEATGSPARSPSSSGTIQETLTPMASAPRLAHKRRRRRSAKWRVRWEGAERSTIELTDYQIDDLLDVLNRASGIDWGCPPPDVQEMLRYGARPGSAVANLGNAPMRPADGQIAPWMLSEAGTTVTASDCHVLASRARQGLLLAQGSSSLPITEVIEYVIAFALIADGFSVKRLS